MIAFPLALIVLLVTRLFTGFTRSPTMPTNTHDDIAVTEPVELGDIVHTADNPILDATGDIQTFNVQVNITHARRPNGHHAIRVLVPENVTLTAAQAHELSVDLGIAAEQIAAIRRDAGYQS